MGNPPIVIYADNWIPVPAGRVFTFLRFQGGLALIAIELDAMAVEELELFQCAERLTLNEPERTGVLDFQGPFRVIERERQAGWSIARLKSSERETRRPSPHTERSGLRHRIAGVFCELRSPETSTRVRGIGRVGFVLS